MTEFEKQSITMALKKMFQGSYFDICVVDKCLKIASAIPPSADYNALAALHCVQWADMSQDFRQQVFVKTLEMFSHTGFPLEQIMQIGATGQLRALQ